MITVEELLAFYSSLDISYRALLHYRFLSRYGKGLDWFIVNEPWRLYPALVEVIGVHNADVFVETLANWLAKNGKRMTSEELKKALSAREAWQTPPSPR
ncbi:MAG: hypothetical protein TU35_000290 [Thermoproteus sp. AZ2]|jgi:hypothetical protein|uniref:Uncharacterized protein n=1 Tax=Thermoproteus sp. AZ2 TaxID=1609232 RepID=A0ACC6UXZ8_9CREN|nr:MAG: hypothetical protein TU35_06435 [Thermoproteus sp. AZ2]